jgi:hypothetical protein
MRHNPEGINRLNTGHKSLSIMINISLMYGIENNFYLGYGFLGHDTVYYTCGCPYFGEIYCSYFQGNLKLEEVWSCEMLVINHLNRCYQNRPTTDHSNGQR